MLPIPVKNTGDVYTAAEFTSWNQDVQNAILSSGIALSGADLFQLGKASAIYSGNGTFYADTGATNAYVLSPIGTLQTPPSYTNGMEIRFVPANINTGASTVNVDGLGIKNIATQIGDTLQGGQLRTGVAITLHFDTSGDEFRLVARDAPLAGEVGRVQLTATTTDVTIQPVVVRDSTNTLDLILDNAITKELDNPFVLGDAAGGRATGVTYIVNRNYHVFLVYNASTGVTDVGFDTSNTAVNILATAPTFTHFRRLWTIRTSPFILDIIPFVKIGNRNYFVNREQVSAAGTGLQAGPTFTLNIGVFCPSFADNITGLFSYFSNATTIGGGGTLTTNFAGFGFNDVYIIAGAQTLPQNAVIATPIQIPIGLQAGGATIKITWTNASGNFQADFNFFQNGWIDNLDIV